jgi:hypothetical protein
VGGRRQKWGWGGPGQPAPSSPGACSGWPHSHTQNSSLRPRTAFPDFSLANSPRFPIGTFHGSLMTNLHGIASSVHWKSYLLPPCHPSPLPPATPRGRARRRDSHFPCRFQRRGTRMSPGVVTPEECHPQPRPKPHPSHPRSPPIPHTPHPKRRARARPAIFGGFHSGCDPFRIS